MLSKVALLAITGLGLSSAEQISITSFLQKNKPSQNSIKIDPIVIP